MNLHQIHTHYTLLSAEERFRLILAASGRDDAIEREKLVAAGPIRNLALSDHWPYAQVPDRLLWRDLPGYRRLEATLEIARQWAFRPIGFLRWLNRIRPQGAPKLQRLPISARHIARTNEQAYRERARWWGAKA